MDNPQDYIRTYISQSDISLNEEEISNISRAYNHIKSSERKSSGFFNIQDGYSIEKIVESLQYCFDGSTFSSESIINKDIQRNNFAHISGDKTIYNGYNLSYSKNTRNFSTGFLKTTSTDNKGKTTTEQKQLFIKALLPNNILEEDRYVIIKKDLHNNFLHKMFISFIISFLIFQFLGKNEDKNGFFDIIQPKIENIGIDSTVFGIGMFVLITYICYIIVSHYTSKNIVKLENRTFEKTFDVESNDQITARQICNTHTMEQLTLRQEEHEAYLKTSDLLTILKGKLNRSILLRENIICIKYDLINNSKLSDIDNIDEENRLLEILVDIYYLLRRTERLYEFFQ